MTDKLLPCPFCGGTPKLRTHRSGEDSMEAYVECPECEIRTTYYEDAYAPTADAMGAWNRRAALPQEHEKNSEQGVSDRSADQEDNNDTGNQNCRTSFKSLEQTTSTVGRRQHDDQCDADDQQFHKLTPLAQGKALELSSFKSDDDLCPICAEPFKPEDICATDIEMGTAHAECLDGCEIVDLETGEPTDKPLSTYRYSEVMEPAPPQTNLLGWQPIKTAPKDGTQIIGRTTQEQVFACNWFWDDEEETEGDWLEYGIDVVRPREWLAMPAPQEHPVGIELPAHIIESLLAIGPVEWGQTFCQSDDKHIDDLRDTLRITRDHFGIEAEETTISYVALEGTGTVLANTGMSPNSAQHARILTAAWNQLVEIARASATTEGQPDASA